MHLRQPVSGQRLDRGQQGTRTMLFVGVMFFTNSSRLHCQWFNLIANQKAGMFIVTNHRIGWIIGQSIERQNQFHPCQKSAVQFANTPALFQMWL
jgi:hypothetical protein